MRLLLAALLTTIISCHSWAQQNGTFSGELDTRWISDPNGPNRKMELHEEFTYSDDSGQTWTVPAGAVVGGASIPEFLFSFAGTPFVGDYTRASVVHDYFCQEDVRSQANSRPAVDVHRMFFYASLADGLDWIKAKVMYGGIYWMGPWWGSDAPSNCYGGCHRASSDRILKASFSEAKFDRLKEWVSEKDPSLEEIEIFVRTLAHASD